MTTPEVWIVQQAGTLGPNDLLVLRVDPGITLGEADRLRAMVDPLLAGRYVIVAVPEVVIVEGGGLVVEAGPAPDPVVARPEPVDRTPPPRQAAGIRERVCSYSLLVEVKPTPCTSPVDHALVYLSAASTIVDRDLVCEAHSLAAFDAAAKTVPNGLIHSVVIRRIDENGDMVP